MKSIITTAAALLAAFFFIPTASAQRSAPATSNPNMKVMVTIGSCKLTKPYMRYSPEVRLTDEPRNLPKPKRWAEFEIPFKVLASPEPKSGFVDGITCKFYIAVMNPDRSKQYLKLTKIIKYANIPVNTETFAVVYLSPSSVRRISGSDGGKSTWVKYAAVVIEYQGKAVAIHSSESGKMEKWYDITSPSIVDTDAYPLLNKNETPFSPFWYDRYPEIMNPKIADKEADATTGEE